MNLRFTPFASEHFGEYQMWYNDAMLDHYLGPMDEEWLNAVLTETDGCQYAVFNEDTLVAVAGVKFPFLHHAEYVITDLAIRPDLQRRGIGSQVLHGLFQKHPLQSGQYWKVYIDKKNQFALKFFEKNGWHYESNEPDEHGMFHLQM